MRFLQKRQRWLGAEHASQKGARGGKREDVVALDTDLDPGPTDKVALGKLLKLYEPKIS